MKRSSFEKKSMLAGVRYSHDDPKLLKLLEVNSLWFQSGNFGAGIVTAYPFLRFIFKEWTGYYKQQYGNQVIYDFLTVKTFPHIFPLSLVVSSISFYFLLISKIVIELLIFFVYSGHDKNSQSSKRLLHKPTKFYRYFSQANWWKSKRWSHFLFHW